MRSTISYHQAKQRHSIFFKPPVSAALLHHHPVFPEPHTAGHAFQEGGARYKITCFCAKLAHPSVLATQRASWTWVSSAAPACALLGAVLFNLRNPSISRKKTIPRCLLRLPASFLVTLFVSCLVCLSPSSPAAAAPRFGLAIIAKPVRSSPCPAASRLQQQSTQIALRSPFVLSPRLAFLEQKTRQPQRFVTVVVFFASACSSLIRSASHTRPGIRGMW